MEKIPIIQKVRCSAPTSQPNEQRRCEVPAPLISEPVEVTREVVSPSSQAPVKVAAEPMKLSQSTIDEVGLNIISTLKRDTKWQSIGCLETVAISLPIHAFGLLSYYLVIPDQLLSMTHWVHSIDNDLRIAKIMIHNDSHLERKFMISWL